MPGHPSLRLSGLTVTRGHFLLVGTRHPAGLLIFDLHGGGPPTLLPWPGGDQAGPFVFSADTAGGAWLLEQTPGSTRVWYLDASLRFSGAVWQQTDSRNAFPACADDAEGPEAVHLTSALPRYVSSQAARDIAAISDRAFLLLTPGNNQSSIRYVFDGVERASVALDETLLADSLEPPARVTGHALAVILDQAALPGRIDATLLVAGSGGNQAYAFSLRAEDTAFQLSPRPDFWPMRSYRGRGLVNHAGTVLYDLGDGLATRWVPLAPHPRRRFVERGELRGIVFDSGLPGCVWHRLLLDACVPPGTRLTVQTRAADRLDELPLESFSPPEPAPYLRADGAEIAFYSPLEEHEASGTWETLLQAAKGRWLEIAIRVEAGGRISPYFRSLRAYAPRFSYLAEYLPDVYQRDPKSAHFLDRFLSNVEGLFTSLEEHIAKAEGYFDPRIAPPEFLDWLAGWFGAKLDQDWDDTRRRLFIDHAEALYRWRGTEAGITALLSLAIDDCVDVALLAALKTGAPCACDRGGFQMRIVERFLVREYGGLALGDPTVTTTLAVTTVDADWEPAQGIEPLHAAWREFLVRSGVNASQDVELSPVEPLDADTAALWREFLSAQPFTYATVTADDTEFYRLFLAQRYLTVEALNTVHGRTGSNAWQSFDDVVLPAEDAFPTGGAPLIDWMRFATIALPIRASAHRFSVLVPTRPGEDSEARRLRLDRIAAIVQRAKPAHTSFDVLPFWALFQVGNARLGLDTQLGEGSRYTAIELGVTGVGQGVLAHGHPWNVQDRAVTGRDSVSEMKL